MEPTEDKTKKPSRRQERITLGVEALQRLDSWIAQLKAQRKGIKIKRSHLIDWLITSRALELTATETRELLEQHFDEIELAAWALNELRAARARGESLSLADLLLPAKPHASPKKRVNSDRGTASNPRTSVPASEIIKPEDDPKLPISKEIGNTHV